MIIFLTVLDAYHFASKKKPGNAENALSGFYK